MLLRAQLRGETGAQPSARRSRISHQWFCRPIQTRWV